MTIYVRRHHSNTYHASGCRVQQATGKRVYSQWNKTINPETSVGPFSYRQQLRIQGATKPQGMANSLQQALDWFWVTCRYLYSKTPKPYLTSSHWCMWSTSLHLYSTHLHSLDPLYIAKILQCSVLHKHSMPICHLFRHTKFQYQTKQGTWVNYYRTT